MLNELEIFEKSPYLFHILKFVCKTTSKLNKLLILCC